MLEWKCPTECIVLIPVRPPTDPNHEFYYEWREEYAYMAIVVIWNAHNHPEHPHTKPSAEDEQRLQTAINAMNIENLTVQTLLHCALRYILLDRTDAFFH